MNSSDLLKSFKRTMSGALHTLLTQGKAYTNVRRENTGVISTHLVDRELYVLTLSFGRGICILVSTNISLDLNYRKK